MSDIESHITTGSASPFLPGTNIQYAWDSTCLGMIKTCPRLYQYTMIEGWGSRDESIHLRFGIEYHKALEEFDKLLASGVDRESAIHATIHNLTVRTAEWHPDPNTKAGRYKNRATLQSLVIDYLDHFEDDPAETYIRLDGQPAVELSFRFELDFGPISHSPGWTGNKCLKCSGHGLYSDNTDREERVCLACGGTGEEHIEGQPYLLSGHLDRVVNFNGELMVMDRKTTTTTISSYYFEQYEPHNQMTLYAFAGKVVLNSPVRGVIIDAAQVMLEGPNRFVRGFTYRNDDQIGEWLDSLRVILAQAESYAIENFWPMNDTACDKFGGCKFREICSKTPSVRENFLKSSFDKLGPEEKWNPLRAR